MQRKVAAAKAQPEQPRLVPPEKGTRDEALELILRPITKRREGLRHGALGAPGYGKTFHMRALVDELLERDLVDLVVTHDTKGAEPEFEARQLVDVAAFDGSTPEQLEQSRHVSFRGDPRAGVDCPAEDVAQLGRRLLVQSELRVALNIGELDQCLTEGGRSWQAPTVRWFSSQGRKIHGSLIWTTQQPKRTPDEVFDQSTTVALYHLDRRAANYLSQTLLLDEDMVAVLPALPIGDFVLWVPGLEWDRKVYRF